MMEVRMKTLLHKGMVVPTGEGSVLWFSGCHSWATSSAS